ncbi:MAG TPA: efflux RND transporter permease subunit, partial [Thermoanaerobaculia bacterium]|nr:efflux RND transporter permease subunit [Thermoanaerobaculia bacterium]
MNLSEVFIRRPVMTTLVMISILVFGLMAYRNLPVSDLPNVDFPTLQVSAALPGASPETMAAAVATPLERQFSTIAGIDQMTSVSTQGGTSITLQFNLERNIDAAAQDVQAAIAAAARQLPPNMPSPPSYNKVNPADQPIIYLALTSETLPLYQLDEYAQTSVAQRISMVPGVAQVQVFGSQKYAVRVQLDPTQLVNRGIGIDEVTSAIRNSNVNLPTGVLHGATQSYTVMATGQLFSADEYRPLAVAYRNGAPVRLAELGRVVDGVENDKTAAWWNNRRGIILAIQKQPGTNTVAVADAVREILTTVRKQLPASVSLNLHRDRSESIRKSVADVKFTLVLTLCLVVMVIFLFLRSVWATTIPSLALPLSIVATFAVMHLLGYSLDNLSLMALTLSVGFVVDDAIVMLENIVRHMERGERPYEAALRGSREIGFTILSMTISLAAVFIPILFMGGILGRLFHEFAVTIGAAILVSGFVSISLTPLLCAKFLRPHTHATPAGSPGTATQEAPSRRRPLHERAFDATLGFYERTLRWVLDHRVATMVVSALILAATFWLYAAIPKGFIPSEDQSAITIQLEAAQGTSFPEMMRYQLQVNQILAQHPDVDAFFSSAGGRGFGASNTGFLGLRLKPRHERERSADQIIADLRPKLNSIPGIRAFLSNPPPIRLGGRGSQSQYQYTMQSADTDELYANAQEMLEKVRKLPGFVDVTSDLQMRNPQITVDIDRDRAAALGLTAQQVEDALYSAYGARPISTIFAPNNQYQVILELQPQFQTDPSALSMLYVRASSGDLVPISSFATLRPSLGPLSVNHSGQLPSVTISFNLKPGVALGDAVEAVDRLGRETLPATMSTQFGGTAQAFQSSLKGLGMLLLMAIAVIYIVLGILYESFIHPLTILSALPFAGFGALVTLMLFRIDLSIYAFVGIIMLVGLVKKNGIMMVDFAIEAQREGKPARDAIFEACLVRFRPIMMTTMAALMGTLPIALGIGAGAESRQPL